VTTHKAHTNLFHNQCLALQSIAIFLEFAGNARNWHAAWVYERAGRKILPELWEGIEEKVEPVLNPAKVIVLDDAPTIPGGYLCDLSEYIERDPFAKVRR
jgi:hypothetical protein